MQIRGAVAVVTGASGGIGEAAARELSSRGATVVLAARSEDLRAPVDTIDLADYRSVMELNVFAVLEAMQAAIPLMRTEGKGLILNVGSMVSKNYFPGLAAYASTKYALNALSLTARQELAAEGITVCVFHPRLTATKFGEHALGTPYDSANLNGMSADSAEDVAKKIADQIESETAEEMMG